MVGILLSYWDGIFSGAMLVSGRVSDPKSARLFPKLPTSIKTSMDKIVVLRYPDDNCAMVFLRSVKIQVTKLKMKVDNHDLQGKNSFRFHIGFLLGCKSHKVLNHHQINMTKKQQQVNLPSFTTTRKPW